MTWIRKMTKLSTNSSLKIKTQSEIVKTSEQFFPYRTLHHLPIIGRVYTWVYIHLTPEKGATTAPNPEKTLTFLDRLGDWYTTSLGAYILVPKKPFLCFLFSVVFQQKIFWSNHQWFHNASNYFEIA